ncbi:MAG: M28 family peptidase [Actinobacteria bacterium]|nr:M28 family peptidase [Actinomycetota bacterium]
MAPLRTSSERRRPRPGSLERPVNARTYRGTALLVAIPLLITAFTISRPEPLPPATLPSVFDQLGATQSARELARQHPNRAPGSSGGGDAADWVTARLESFGFRVQRDAWDARIPGRGSERLENVFAVSPGRSPETLVVMAHRDNLGVGPGANDNASGTGVLLELARGYGLRTAAAPGEGTPLASPARTIVFLSTDGGAFGGIGAVRFLETSPYRSRLAAALNVVAVGGSERVRIEIAGDRPRSPDATLVETAAARVQPAGTEARRTSALGQLVDLAFPFTLYEQGPFIGQGIPTVTLTAAGLRPPRPIGDTVENLVDSRIGQAGRAAEGILGSLDEGVALAGDTSSYLFLGPRIVQGWAVKLVLITALLPFLLAAVDLFARCRRRRIPLAPAFRSYRSRLGIWVWIGIVFAAFALLGIWPGGASRPPPPDGVTAGDWPVVALSVFGVLALAGWLVGRERLLPRRTVSAEEELAGQTAALVVLGVLALLTTALNPFALVFLLPSLHAWLWLPQFRYSAPWVRAASFIAGLAGPVLLVGSLAWRLDLGLDAPWYLLQLVETGLVPLPAVVLSLAWLAAAGQLIAVAAGRYAPYPEARERPPRGQLRELVRRLLLVALGRRGRPELRRAAGS